MTARKCRNCGKTNPSFFTHCISCGVKLEDEIKKTIPVYNHLKTGMVIGVSVILVIAVILMTVQFTGTYGQNFTQAVSAIPAADIQNASEYRMNQPVGNSDLQVMVTSAHDGQNAFNSSKFFIVSVFFKNIRTEGNIRVSNNDFELIDSEGREYFLYGIGSHVMVDLSPSQEITSELTFVIPQTAEGTKIRFMFPAISAFTGHRNVVTFVI